MSLSRQVFALLFSALFALPTAASAADGALQTLSLSAVAAAGAEPLRDVHFSVKSLDAGSGLEVKALSESGPAEVQVPAGRYKVTATFGHTKVEEQVTVSNGGSRVQIALNAGTVFMKLLHNVGGKTYTTGVTWEILTYGKDASGKRHLLASSKQAQPKFVLPEGFYLARASTGTQHVKHTIEVTSGVTYKYTVILQ